MPNCPEVDFDKKHNRMEIVMSTNGVYDIRQELFDSQLITYFPKFNMPSLNYFSNDSLQVSGERQLIYQEPRALKRYYLIADKFVSDFQQKGKVFIPDYDTNFILNNSLYLIKELINIGAENISFEFTEDQSILFSSNLSGLNVYCEVYFDNENELNEIEVITNIYKERKQIFTSTSDLTEAISQINSTKLQIENKDGAINADRNLPETTRPAEPLPDYGSLQLAVF